MLWDREKIRIKISQLHRLRKDISYTGIRDDYPHLLFAAVHYFPNWGHAITSCGIDYGEVRRQEVWNKTRVRKELMKLYKEGEDLSYNKFQRKHPQLLPAAAYHFGSWENAVSAIRVDYEKIRKLKRWSKEEVSKQIRSLKKEGVDLSFRAMFRQGHGAVVSMGAFYYGSWRKAVEETGFDYDKIRKRQIWNKNKVMKMVRQLHGQGIEVSYQKLREQGYGNLVSMGCYYFKNWGDAVEKSGLDYSKIKRKPGPEKLEKNKGKKKSRNSRK